MRLQVLIALKKKDMQSSKGLRQQTCRSGPIWYFNLRKFLCNLYKFKHFLAFKCFFVLFILIRYINGGQRLASGKKQDLLKKSPLPTGFGSSSPVDKCMQLYLYLILCFIKKNSKLLLSYCTMFFCKIILPCSQNTPV